MKMNLDKALETAIALTQNAGRYAIEQYGTKRISWKEEIDARQGIPSFREIARSAVTSVDYRCQRIILDGIIEAGFHRSTGILAEEKMRKLAAQFDSSARYRWVIDPTDGSLNFATANPDARAELEKRLGSALHLKHTYFGISIGLEDRQDGYFKLAVVSLPMLQEFYVAKQGEGATKNDVCLQVPETTFSDDAVISLSSHAGFAKELFCWEQPFCTVYSLTGIAAGKHAGYIGINKPLYDVGPASLILTEAGGDICNEHGKDICFTNFGQEGKIPVFIAGVSRDFNRAMLEKVQKSGYRFDTRRS